MTKLKLTIELVPASSWADNVRTILSKKQWDYLRSQVASKAYNICEICGGIGPKHPVECHEIWSYDNKNLVQKLEGMIALCPDCHMVKHMGFAIIKGKEIQALRHLMSVNKMTKKEAKAYIQEAFRIWEERSQKEWTLDLSYLKECGIDPDKI